MDHNNVDQDYITHYQLWYNLYQCWWLMMLSQPNTSI
jgi:hypothetical protein